jgi:hypothetical protein
MQTERQKLLKYWEENQDDKFSESDWKLIYEAQQAGFKNFYSFFQKCKEQYGIVKGRKEFLQELKLFIDDMKFAEKVAKRFVEDFEKTFNQVDRIMNDNYKNGT